MVSRIPVLALLGLVVLGCKTTEPGDTDSNDSSTSATTSTTAQPTTVDPPTTGTTGTSAPTTGDSSGEPSTSTTTTTTSSSSTTADSESSTTATTGEATTGPVGPCKPLACDGKTYACGDCEDNDGDGKVDLQDPECISPCDDKEDTFATGLPGDNMDPCKQDCFFDGNSGKDACDWNLACDPQNPGGDSCPYDPKKTCEAAQPAQCAETCGVPNGCDCFGCCTVVVGGVPHDIFLGDKTCTLAEIDSCQTCTKNADCDDACDPDACEICFGGELPDGCDNPTCETGDPCVLDKEGNSNCADGLFCQTGCCVAIVPG